LFEAILAAGRLSAYTAVGSPLPTSSSRTDRKSIIAFLRFSVFVVGVVLDHRLAMPIAFGDVGMIDRDVRDARLHVPIHGISAILENAGNQPLRRTGGFGGVVHEASLDLPPLL